MSQEGIQIDRAEVEVITNLPLLTLVREVRSFLDHVGFYRRFIKDSSKITKPLSNLLARDVPFVFSNKCMQAYMLLKEKLTSAPILIAAEWGKSFEMNLFRFK